MIYIYIYRPLKPCFHLAMVLTLLTQHQLVVSKNVHIHIYERGLSYLKMFIMSEACSLIISF